jgi:anaerobic selenocysteine-containing dehydrogenase
VIVIDPVRHASAEKADIHVQPFPGSDAALAFGLMHAIHRAGRVDEAFLEAHTLGWDELEPLVENATPEWTAEVTGIPVTTIEEVARRYAQGPSLLWLGQGLQRQPHGGNVMRACAALPAITGNLGKPGAGLCYLNGDGPRNIDADIVGAPHLRRAPASSIGHMDLADALADPQRTRAFFCWNMNVAASAPRQRALRGALAREDLFSVVVELFQTDTADFADIVLPAASFLEFDDLVVPYFHLLLSAQAKAVDPPGEALSAAWRAPWGTQSASSTHPTAKSSTSCWRDPGWASTSTRARAAAPSTPSPSPSSPSPTSNFRPRRVASSSPLRAPKPTDTRACRSRTPTRNRRGAHCGCCLPRAAG